MTDPGKKPTVLVISNADADRAALLRYLTLTGFNTFVAEETEEAIRYLAAAPDLILLDMLVSGQDGVLILRDLHEKNDQARILLMTETADIPKAQAALDYGARDYITKPLQLPTLKRILQVHLKP